MAHAQNSPYDQNQYEKSYYNNNQQQQQQQSYQDASLTVPLYGAQKTIDVSVNPYTSNAQNGDYDNDEEADRYSQGAPPADEAAESLYKMCLMRTVYLAVTFLVTMSSFASMQNIIGQIYEQLNFGPLGLYTLFVLYIGFGAGNFWAPGLLTKYGQKKVLIFGAIVYAVFQATGLVMSQCEGGAEYWFCQRNYAYAQALAFGGILGLTASVWWFAASLYHQAVSDLIGPDRGGFVIGVFWSLLCCCQLTGNYMMKELMAISTQAYFIVSFLLTLVAVGMQFFVIEMVPESHKEAVAAQARASKKQQREDQRNELIKFFALLKHPSTRPVLIYSIYGGLHIAFFTGFLYKLVLQTVDPVVAAQDPRAVNVISSQIFTILGVADVLTGFVVGKLTACFTPTTLAVIQISIGIVTFLVSIVEYQMQSYSLCVIVAILSGILDCYFNCAITFICNQYYRGHTEIFGIYRIGQMWGCAAMQVVSAQVSQPMVYLLLVLGLAIYGFTQTQKIHAPTEQEWAEVDRAIQEAKAADKAPAKKSRGKGKKPSASGAPQQKAVELKKMSPLNKKNAAG